MENQTQVENQAQKPIMVKVKISLVNGKEFELFVQFENPNISVEDVATRVLGGPSVSIMNFIDVNGAPVSVIKSHICSIETIVANNNATPNI